MAVNGTLIIIKMQEIDLNEIGVRVRIIREEQDLSQIELAEQSGYNKKTISLVENGHTRPGEKLILFLSQNFKANSEWIITGKGEKYYNKKSDSKSINVLHAKVVSLEMELSEVKSILEKVLKKLT